MVVTSVMMSSSGTMKLRPTTGHRNSGLAQAISGS